MKMLTIAYFHVLCSVFSYCVPSAVLHSPGKAIVQEPIETEKIFDYSNKKQSDSEDYKISETVIGSKRDISKNPIVWIKDGGLKGFQMETLTGKKFGAFQNIPFAQPPVGPLRFREPIKNAGWEGIRDATGTSPTCLQTDFIQLYNVTGQEDCLYLNVYTPKLGNEPLPVMVFIHGGGFFFGSSNLYGPIYLMEEDVVLVSMNYRLGPFGFLSTGDDASPGNNGLKDQVLALKWVQENIGAFGGDKSRVTIFGESAGASSVQFHMVSKQSKGLFHRGISQSGSSFCFWSIDEKTVEFGKQFANIYGCTQQDSFERIECLRKIDGKLLVQGQLSFLKWNMYPVVLFGPVIEKKHRNAFLDDLPGNIYARGEAAQVPWISGYNLDEGALNLASIITNPSLLLEINGNWDKIVPIFLEFEESTENAEETAQQIKNFYLGKRNISFDTRNEAIQMFSDRYLIACGVDAIEHHAKLNTQPVFAYMFNYKGSYGMVNLIGQKTEDWGVAHLDDLIYLMNNTMYYAELKATDEEFQFSNLLVNIWSNFARTGIPTVTLPSKKSFNWEPVSTTSSELKFLELNMDPKMIENPYTKRLEFWKSLKLAESV